MPPRPKKRPQRSSRPPKSRPARPGSTPSRFSDSDDAAITPRPAEQLLIDTLPDLRGARVLCTSLGRAQFAVACAQALPESSVVCNFLDIHLRDRARDFHPVLPANVFTRGGDSELARELLQAGHVALRGGGRLVAASDNPDDRWLHERMRDMFPKVTARRLDSGAVYLATKGDPLKKVKDFSCTFAFRDEGRLIQAVSRPGVFSHRHVDGGARALMEAMDVRENERVVDIGCGSGVVSLAAAFRAPGVTVQAIDSNPRAVECTRQGAALNGLQNVEAILDAGPRHDPPGSCDLALANPPYYSNYQIAEIFLQRGISALRPEGRILVVTKQPDWYAERMPQLFGEVTAETVKTYVVLQGRGVRGR